MLGAMLMFAILHITALSKQKELRLSMLQTMNMYAIAIMALLMFTLFQPLILTFAISAYFIHEGSSTTQSTNYFIQIVLATINLLIISFFGAFGSNFYYQEVSFLQNSLGREHSFAPLIDTSQKILLMFTLYVATEYDDEGSTQAKVASTLVPICCTISFLALIYKIFKMRTLNAAKIVSCLLSTAVTCVLLVSFLHDGMIFQKNAQFLQLVWYSLLLTVFYSIGFFLQYQYLHNKKYKALLSPKMLDEHRWIDGLRICVAKLKRLIANDINTIHLMDLTLLIKHHQDFCNDFDCVCKQKKAYLRQIHRQQMEEENEIFLQEISGDNMIKVDTGTYENKQKILFVEYMINFLIMLTKKALMQNPQSIELVNIGIEIIGISHNSRTMAAQFLLLNLNSKGYNTVQNIKLTQLQYLVQKNFANNGKLDDFINPDALIYHHILQKKLKDTLSSLSDEVLQFWILFKNKQQSVLKMSAQQNNYAQLIIRVQKLFQRLEETNQDKLYTFFTQSLLHRLIYNDPAAGINYLRKLQSFNDMNKLFRRVENGESPEICFMIVDAKPNSIGRVLAANKSISIQLGYDVGELEKNNNIDRIMPKNIRKLHSQLMKNMMLTGQGGDKFSAAGSNVFIIKKNGYISLMNLKVKLIYTAEYELVYIVSFQKLENIKLHDIASEGMRVKDTMIFLCDERGLQISNISQGCYTHLHLDVGLLGTSEFNTKNEFLSLYDIIGDHQFLETFEQKKNIDVVTQNLDIDQNCIYYLTHTALRQNKDTIIPCTIQLRRQLIFSDKNAVNSLYQITVFIYFDQQPTSMAIVKGQNKENNQTDFQFNDQLDSELNKQAMEQEIAGDDNSSQDSTHTNSSNLNEQSPENIKQFLSASVTNRIDSKSLGIVFKLVIFLFLVMPIIGVINLGLTLQRHNNQNKEIQIVKQSYDRLNYHAKVRVLLRNLVNMANDYEPLSSSYEADRVTLIKSVLSGYLYTIKNIQDYLDLVANQNMYGFVMPQRIVGVQSLNNDFNVTNVDYSYSVAYHLFLSSFLNLISQNLTAMTGRTVVQRIIADDTGTPTENEKLTAFVVFNSMGDIITRNWQEVQDYSLQSKQHALSSSKDNMITTIVSIIAIFLVGCAITPMISQFYKRKYESLNFFLALTPEQLDAAIDNCNQFNQQIDEEIKTIKAIKSRIKQTTGIRRALGNGAPNNLISQSSSSFIIHSRSNDSQIMDSFSNNTSQHSLISQSDVHLISVSKHQLAANRSLSNNNSKNATIQEKLQNQDEVDEVDAFAADDYSQSVSSVAKSYLGNSKSQKHDLTQQQPISNQPDENKIQEQDQKSKEQEEASTKLKLQLLVKLAQRNIQIKTFLVIGMLIGIFALYFLGTYILALKSFNNIPEIVNNLKLIFSKDACVENSIAYVRENELLNYTVYMDADMTETGQEEIGSTFTLNQCLELEDNYRSLRKDLPIYFKDAQSYINNIEIEMCDNLKIAAITTAECKSSFSGLMNIGYSQAVAVVLSKFKQIDLIYFSNKNYSLPWITDIVQDIEQINLMEINEFYIFEIASTLKSKIVDSTLNYFKGLRQSYVIIFCVFIIFVLFLLILFLLFTHKQMRHQNLLTSQSFRVIPLEFMKKEELIHLKQFCLN